MSKSTISCTIDYSVQVKFVIIWFATSKAISMDVELGTEASLGNIVCCWIVLTIGPFTVKNN